MAKRAQRSKERSVRFGRVGVIGGLAIACLAGGYFVSKSHVKFKETVAALLPQRKSPAGSPAVAAKPVPEKKAEALPAETPSIRASDKARLARLIKTLSPPRAADSAELEEGNEPSPLGITLLDNEASDPISRGPDKMTLSVAFANEAGKPIRAFEGILSFIDRLDRKIYSSKVSISARMAEGTSLRWDEQLDQRKLDDRAKRRLGAERENLKAVFHVHKIFFVDGSVKKYGARG